MRKKLIIKCNIFLILLLFFNNLSTLSQELTILHTNDIHSNLTGFGPESSYSPLLVNDDSTQGGFSRLATLISTERAKNDSSLIVCDAGDFLMGTVFQALEPSTGFQLRLMKQMGFDVVTLGNHEFDFGPEALADIINAGMKNGKIPEIVASQLQFSEQSTKDDKLKKLFDEKVINPYIILKRNGLKIGIFGILGYDAIFSSPNAKPIKFTDMIKASGQITKHLREKENVDIVMCLSHSGVYTSEKGKRIGDDIKLAKKVPDIDIIISGHSHFETPEYWQIGKTIVVQTGCYLHNLGILKINYNNKKVLVSEFKLIKIDDKIHGDKTIDKMITEQKKIINKKLFSPYGYEYSEPIAETNFDIPKAYYSPNAQSAAGNLIPDALLYFVNTFSDSTDITIAAQGVIREDILTKEITPADIFRVLPLGYGTNDWIGYSLAKTYITAEELKKLAELAIFINKPGESVYLFFAGMKVKYNPKGLFLHKVKKIYINGQEIDFSKKNKKLYSVTTNTYIMTFIGLIKKMSKGMLSITPKDANGKPIKNNILIDIDKTKDGLQEAKEWIAILKYLQTFEDTDNNGLPNIPEKYKKYNNAFSAIKK